MGILDFPRPCNCGDIGCTHCVVNSTMFSLIKKAWDYNWKSLSIDNFWNSVPHEKKTLIISKLKNSVSEENRHEFLIRNSLSKENRKFLIDTFNCKLESGKFVFHQNKQIPIRYIPFVIREASEEEFKYEETTLGRELDENNIPLEELKKINQLQGGQNYGSYRKTKTGKIMKKKLHLELLSEYNKTNQIDNSISYKKEILREKEPGIGLQDYGVTYWTPDKERFYEVVEEQCCISENEMTDGFLTDLIVEKIAGNSDFLKKYEEYVEQAIKKQEEELKYYEELRLNRERQRLNRERQRLEEKRKEKERIERISMIAEERKRLEEEKKIANRERNRQRQLEKNQKEKEARKLLEQKKKEEDQALNEAVKENQKLNIPVVSAKSESKKSKKNKKKQTLIIEEVSQDEVSQKETTMMSDTRLKIPESEFFMKNFVGPMWNIKYGNESSQNMNDSLHNTSEPILKGTLHTEGNKITGAEIYPPVNSQHVLRLPEMPQPPERPPGEFIVLNADTKMPQPPERPPGEFILLNADTIYGKNESVAPQLYLSHCENCNMCLDNECIESHVFHNLNRKQTEIVVQNLFESKKANRFTFKGSGQPVSLTFDFDGTGRNKKNSTEIFFAALVSPNKERLCHTFIERMYYRLYGNHPHVTKVANNTRKELDKCINKKKLEELTKSVNPDSVFCFNDWVMSLNDDQFDIFFVSYIYCVMYSYCRNSQMEGQPYNLEYFVMVC